MHNASLLTAGGQTRTVPRVFVFLTPEMSNLAQVGNFPGFASSLNDVVCLRVLFRWLSKFARTFALKLALVEKKLT